MSAHSITDIIDNPIVWHWQFYGVRKLRRFSSPFVFSVSVHVPSHSPIFRQKVLNYVRLPFDIQLKGV